MPIQRQARKPYHHGNLRRTLLERAVSVIENDGAAALSLRDIARRAGVSNAAPVHHFRDKKTLLTVVATEGYGRLADALRAAYESSGEFLEVGVAYVRFAIENRGYFDVMFRPDLYDAKDPLLVAARARSSAILYGRVEEASGHRSTARLAGIAAWSLVHGLATLLINGILPADLGDPSALTRSVASYLFSGKSASGRRKRIHAAASHCSGLA